MISSSAGNRIRRACARMAVAACVTAVPLVVLAGNASAVAPSDMAVANSWFSTGPCDPGSAAPNRCTDSESRDQTDQTGETASPPAEYPRYSEYSYGGYSYGGYSFGDYENYGDRFGNDRTYGGDHTGNDRTSSGGDRSSHDQHDGHDRS